MSRGRDDHIIPRTYRVLVAVGQALFFALRLRPDPHGLDRIPRAGGAEGAGRPSDRQGAGRRWGPGAQPPVQGGAVLAITHFGYLDFALTAWVLWRHSSRWIRFLATKASFSHPVSGPMMRAMRHIAVDRTKGTAAYHDAVQALRAGHLVGVFPEGRVTGDWEVLPCAGGAARMASAADVPLIPVAVWGGHSVMTRTHRFSPSAAFGATIAVHVGEPRRVPVAVADDAGPWLHDQLASLMREAQTAYPDRPRRAADRWWLPAARSSAS